MRKPLAVSHQPSAFAFAFGEAWPGFWPVTRRRALGSTLASPAEPTEKLKADGRWLMAAPEAQ